VFNSADQAPTAGQPGPGSGQENQAGDLGSSTAPPRLSLPKGGGAIRGIGEKFSANPVTGTASFSVPILTSPGRSGFGPQLLLTYNSGTGNGPFGVGWDVSLPSISRKTDKGIPRYQDDLESDVFILSDAEDLVPELIEGAEQGRRAGPTREVDGVVYRVRRYRPRVESVFARIEKWTDVRTGTTHWRSISRDNVTARYGFSADSRICDPDDPTKIFRWLICQSHDDRGNLIRFSYKPENSVGVDVAAPHESHRAPATRSANRYLKSIRYGNRAPYRPGGPGEDREWLFEVVFDYGEHDRNRPTPQEAGPWLCRHDAFSSCRAGFEVRTYRLCQRVLMFHHFPDEPGVGRDCLVGATEFAYQDSRGHPDDRRRGNPVASFLASITQRGYRRAAHGGYVSAAFPPIDLTYSQPVVDDRVRETDAAGATSLDQRCQWVDLDGEGLSGILTEQAGTWFYQANLGQGRFGSTEPVGSLPALASLTDRTQQLLDLDGDGSLDLVTFGRPTPGHFERSAHTWHTFRSFQSTPVIDWNDPNLRLIDLDGDGRLDLVMSEDNVVTWYRCLGERGFDAAQRVAQPFDEQPGARLVFADPSQSIFLGDMSGDGLTDIVRVRNGEVCYWPNMGYGRFGAKVTMDAAPWFDAIDLFDTRRIRLADIDGSGTSDLIYLGAQGVDLYANQAGNGWGPARHLRSVPRPDQLASVSVFDLLGTGTACLVWSDGLPGGPAQPIRYVDLTGGRKPHLLTCVANNLGSETRVSYAPSTRFYVADKEAGRPWSTRLPFPVQVVERTEVLDRVSHNRFVTRYAYHHGYFDGVEREFRGFGMVEQWDTEEFASLGAAESFTNWDAAGYLPPVFTRSWFHVGAPPAGDHAATGEYYRPPGSTEAEARAQLLGEPDLPAGLDPDEAREAHRALKGSQLRTEVYALDGTDREPHPYEVRQQSFAVRLLQPRSGNRHAVFFTHVSESLDTYLERDPSDPRVSHTLTLDVDEFGNVRKSVVVNYGRRRADPSLPADQAQMQLRSLITYAENDFTNLVSEHDTYRTPRPCANRSYELTGYRPSGLGGRFRAADFVRRTGTGLVMVLDGSIAFEQPPGPGRLRRLVEHTRSYLRPDDLGGSDGGVLRLLPLGRMQPLAVPGESYKLAFTPGLLGEVYRRPGDGAGPEDVLSELPAGLTGGGGSGGGYVDLDGDGCLWAPSGRVFYSPDPDDLPQTELDHARAHFFLPCRYRDPFHTAEASTETLITYDGYDLLAQETRDPLGNRITVGERHPDPDRPLVRHGQDYRVLRPALLMDANRNRSAVSYDARGMVAITAVTGKPEDDPRQGDLLDGQPDLSDRDVLAFLDDPGTHSPTLLGRATSRLVYDFFAYARSRHQAQPQPAMACALVRETHDADLQPGQPARIQHTFSYSDGFGREVQRKIPAAPGPVPDRDPRTGRIITMATADGARPRISRRDQSPRWIGTGWTVYNNKAKPVRQYEPFFTDTHRFEFDLRIGVSPILVHDPLGRVVATLQPNHTYTKVVFDAWRQEAWDASDTVLLDPGEDAHVGGFVRRLQPEECRPTWYQRRADGGLGPHEQDAARKAARHAGTPSVSHVDSLGRTFLALAHNRTAPADGAPVTEEWLPSLTILDIDNNPRAVFDPLGRVVARFEYDLMRNRIHESTMDAGERWVLGDAAGKPLYSWDSRGYRSRMSYDALRRPVATRLASRSAPEVVTVRTVYGETRAEPERDNLRGRIFQTFDQTRVATCGRYDFKGNPVSRSRRLVAGPPGLRDWSGEVPLEDEAYPTAARYDGLNRRVEETLPDATVIRCELNVAGQLVRIEAGIGGDAPAVFVAAAEYDARGQLTSTIYGNGVRTDREYDASTFRLVRQVTRRDVRAFPGDCPPAGTGAWPGCHVQDLRYTVDPTGNVTHIQDRAQQAIYFRNRRVDPDADYTYDALYRLIRATGREHLGQDGDGRARSAPAMVASEHPSDGRAMARYIEEYRYDRAGNIVWLRHRGADAGHPGWTRRYTYTEPSQLEPGTSGNRLSGISTGDDTDVFRYAGPAGRHGNPTTMPRLAMLDWDPLDQLTATATQVVADGGTPETTRYGYDAAGQRVRKVTYAAAGSPAPRRKERIYLGHYEVYREYGHDGSTVALERVSSHIMAGEQRIALVETRTRGDDRGPARISRFQFTDHLGSSALELDDDGRVLSYEQYLPYGSTSYYAAAGQTEAPKRYRYTGKERDEETGLDYHRSRYYAPWLGRWLNADPAGLKGGLNLFAYAAGNPVALVDPGGTQPDPPDADNPELMCTWRYDTPVPDRASLGHNVQRDHPIQVSLRSEQRTSPSGVEYYNRSVSAEQGELTILAETGRGYFHTEVGRLQRQINLRVRAGLITSESQLIEETRAAYQQAAAATGVTVVESELDAAIISNLASLSGQTSSELQAAGVLAGDFPDDAAFDRAFYDPDVVAPAGEGLMCVQTPEPTTPDLVTAAPEAEVPTGQLASSDAELASMASRTEEELSSVASSSEGDMASLAARETGGMLGELAGGALFVVGLFFASRSAEEARARGDDVGETLSWLTAVPNPVVSLYAATIKAGLWDPQMAVWSRVHECQGVPMADAMGEIDPGDPIRLKCAEFYPERYRPTLEEVMRESGF
jgi:RHS repeat-associated protein